MHHYPPPLPRDTFVHTLLCAGYQAYYVGGAVRDEVMGYVAKDIDIATDASPEQVMAALTAAGIDVYETGIAHGTITAIKDGHQAEITTFRQDVTTDGRNATVSYGRSIHEDAARRDFTFNALYRDISGHILDPLGSGLHDAAGGRVRFIGTPDERIREDYLRILRYVRFFARYSREARAPQTYIEAMARHVPDMLRIVSKERVWAEMKKILSLPRVDQAVEVLRDIGLLDEVMGIPAQYRTRAVRAPGHTSLSWARNYVLLFGEATPELPLSRDERRTITRIADATSRMLPPRGAAFTYGREIAYEAHLVQMDRLHLPPLPEHEFDRLCDRTPEKMPITAGTLISAGIAPGPRLGRVYSSAEAAFVAGNCASTAQQLLTIALLEDKFLGTFSGQV